MVSHLRTRDLELKMKSLHLDGGDRDHIFFTRGRRGDKSKELNDRIHSQSKS